MPLWLQIPIGLAFGLAADIALLWLARRYLGLDIPKIVTITLGKADVRRAYEIGYTRGFRVGAAAGSHQPEPGQDPR